MAKRWTRPNPGFYAAIVVFSITAVAAAWILVGDAARRSYLDMSIKARGLQAEIAARSMEESFRVTIEQSTIIANFSLPEYFEGKRSDVSMDALLDKQRRTLRGMIADGYVDEAGRLRFESVAPGSDYALEALFARAPEARAALESPARSAPFVVASGEPEPYFIYYHPVMKGRELTGLLGAAVDFGPAIDKYLSPLAALPGRNVTVLDELGTRLWASTDSGRVPLPSRDYESSSSFLIGGERFWIRIDDDEGAMGSSLLPLERLRTVVAIAGALLVAAAILVAFKLYTAEAGRRALAAEERRLEAAVRAREEELMDSELRYGALMEAASDSILILDESWTILRCNRSARLLFGREALEGAKLEELSAERQGDLPLSEALVRFRERTSRESSFSFEWFFKRGGGEDILIEAGFAMVRSSSGDYAQLILRDVTEKRRQMLLLQESLDQREILLRELHHRVKNNLQLIISLIALQREGSGPEADAALRKTQDRISALAAAYLAAADRPESLEIDIEDYLRTVCDQVRDEAAASGTTIAVDLCCEKLNLGLGAAVSIGLIVRELAENSAMHGYGPGSSGRLSIVVRSEGGNAVFELDDRGRGLAPSQPEGLGLRLARALAAQLSGNLELRAGPEGTRARLEFPLS